MARGGRRHLGHGREASIAHQFLLRSPEEVAAPGFLPGPKSLFGAFCYMYCPRDSFTSQTGGRFRPRESFRSLAKRIRLSDTSSSCRETSERSLCHSRRDESQQGCAPKPQLILPTLSLGRHLGPLTRRRGRARTPPHGPARAAPGLLLRDTRLGAAPGGLATRVLALFFSL